MSKIREILSTHFNGKRNVTNQDFVQAEQEILKLINELIPYKRYIYGGSDAGDFYQAWNACCEEMSKRIKQVFGA